VKIVLQRVKNASVRVDGKIKGNIKKGLCLFVGIEKKDIEKDAEYLSKKIVELRIFPDKTGKMNLSLSEEGGCVLVISQFTLAGSVRKGRRPSFDGAEEPNKAEKLFNYFTGLLQNQGLNVETGEFGAMMEVSLINDGPVTFILQSNISYE